MYRSLVLGLLGACVMLLAQRPVAYIHVAAPSAESTFAAPSPRAAGASVAPTITVPPTIIDASASLVCPRSATTGCDALQLWALLHLAPDERVIGLQDERFDATLGGALALFTAPKVSGTYIDVTVSGPRGERRVLVLMH